MPDRVNRGWKPLPQSKIAQWIYEVSFSIRLATFQASGGAHMKLGRNGMVSFWLDWTLAARGGACIKLHEIRFHFQEGSHRRARGDYLKFSFSAFFAISAVNYYVSCSIRPAVFLAGGGADTWNLLLPHRLSGSGFNVPGWKPPNSSSYQKESVFIEFIKPFHRMGYVGYSGSRSIW